jgi:hypothetical protein
MLRGKPRTHALSVYPVHSRLCCRSKSLMPCGFADPELEDDALGAIFRTSLGTAWLAPTYRRPFILRLAWV